MPHILKKQPKLQIRNGTILVSLATVLLVLIFEGCQVGRFVIYNFADVSDYKKFPSRPLTPVAPVFYFHETDAGRVPKTVTVQKFKNTPFETFLKETQTVAFLIIQHDTIQYEQYFHGYDAAGIVPSFSMAKSVTSILIGCAIDDGYIKNTEEPVIKYVPELDAKKFADLKIIHLLQMTSGIKFNESYTNPFGDAAGFYYGRRLRNKIAKMEPAKPPGTEFEYASGNTQLLGLVLERALKNISVTEYLQAKIWSRLGMEFDASWSIDKKNNGLEKTFCCINARARDYAKIGRLYLHNGNWEGEQIVPADWVKTSTAVDTSGHSAPYYQYQWWLPSKNGDFMAAGILGQYIYVNPGKDLIIVRLGKKEGDGAWWNVFTSLAASY